VNAVLTDPPAVNPPERVYPLPPINMRGQNCPPNPPPPSPPPLPPEPPTNGEKDDGWHENLIWSDKTPLGSWGSDVAVDSEDNVISVGEGVAAASAYIVKYDENGAELWHRTLDAVYISNEVTVEIEPGGDEYPLAKGTVPSIEWYMNESVQQRILHLFDMDHVQFEGAYGFNFKGVCVDNNDNIIASGYLIVEVLAGEGELPFLCMLVYTTKYTPDGTQLWQKLHFFQLLSFGVDVGVDSDGNIFVAAVAVSYENGRLLDSFGWTIKMDSEGHRLGSFLYWLIDGDEWAFPMPWKLEVDSDNHIWVAGILLSWGGPRDGWDEDQDIYVLEYTFNGLLLNEWEFDTGESKYEMLWGMSVDNEGNVMLTGTIGDQHGYDAYGDCHVTNARAFIAKFNEQGTLSWITEDYGVSLYRSVTSPGTIADNESIITTSSLDGQYTFYIYNYADGQIRHCFSKGDKITEEAQSVLFDHENNIIATGTSNPLYMSSRMYTMKVNVTFSLLENEPI
jgi:hypothetical protein